MRGGEIHDAALVEAARKGETSAFDLLVRRHQGAVRAFGRRLAGAVGDGDDIAQSAFMLAWQARATWRGGSFKSWVCTIAYREFLRTRSSSGRKVSESELDELRAEETNDSDRIDLLRAFAKLGVQERAAVAFCLGAGMSHSEASIAMHAPVGSVKSWVARGREKLKDELAIYAKV